MNKHPTVATRDMTVKKVIEMMIESTHDTLPIVHGGKVIGIVGYSDIILQPVEKKDEEVM